MDRSILLPMDTKLLYYIRSPSWNCIEVYHFVNWYEAFETNRFHTFRPRCRHVASLNRVLSELDGGSSNAGQAIPPHVLHNDSVKRVWNFFESQRPRDGRRLGVSVGWPIGSMGEADEDEWFRYNRKSLDKYCRLHDTFVDSRKLPRLHDRWWFYFTLRLCVRRQKEEACSLPLRRNPQDLQKDGGGFSP